MERSCGTGAQPPDSGGRALAITVLRGVGSFVNTNSARRRWPPNGEFAARRGRVLGCVLPVHAGVDTAENVPLGVYAQTATC